MSPEKQRQRGTTIMTYRTDPFGCSEILLNPSARSQFENPSHWLHPPCPHLFLKIIPCFDLILLTTLAVPDPIGCSGPNRALKAIV